MNIVAQHDVNDKRVIMQRYKDLRYSVRCINYKSPRYKSPFRSRYDYSNFSYTLAVGEFYTIFTLFCEECDYINRLYKEERNSFGL